MALMNMYPIGEEAMDLRFASVTGVLQSGLGTIQIKRPSRIKIKGIFDREFWRKPMSTKALSDKIMSMFKAMGMKTEDDDG